MFVTMKPPRNTFKQESYRDLHKIDPPCRTCATISLANDFQIRTYTLRYVMWSRNNNKIIKQNDRIRNDNDTPNIVTIATT